MTQTLPSARRSHLFFLVWSDHLLSCRRQILGKNVRWIFATVVSWRFESTSESKSYSAADQSDNSSSHNWLMMTSSQSYCREDDLVRFWRLWGRLQTVHGHEDCYTGTERKYVSGECHATDEMNERIMNNIEEWKFFTSVNKRTAAAGKHLYCILANEKPSVNYTCIAGIVTEIMLGFFMVPYRVFILRHNGSVYLIPCASLIIGFLALSV